MTHLTRSKRARVRALTLALFSALVLTAPPAHAMQRIVGLEHAANLFNMCVAGSWAQTPGPGRDESLEMCCTLASFDCRNLCDAKYPGQEGEEDAYWFQLLACYEACGRAEDSCKGGALVTPASGELPGYYTEPRVEEISPELRVDYCLEDNTGCGGPAAHTFCDRYEGPGWVARSWRADGIASSEEDPTWQIGKWFPRQAYGTGQSFEYIECVPDPHAPLLVDIPWDDDDDGVDDAFDNCEMEPNPLQRNQDGDLFGDLCDPEPDISQVCWNGVDDDGDGLSDLDDPGCTGFDDDAETEASLVCDNGLDDDGDGPIDLDDPNCTDPEDRSEVANRCGDGLDDDGDGLVDLADPGCTSLEDDSEYGDVWTTDYDSTAHQICSYFSCSGWWRWSDPEFSRHLADVDGDGRDDVVAFGRSGVEVALAEEGQFASGGLWTSDFSHSSFGFGWDDKRPPRFVEDMDGDGRADLVVFYGTTVYVARSTGSSFGPSEAWSTPGELGTDRFLDPWGDGSGDGEVFLEDLDADGRLDVVLFDDGGTVVALHTGTGFGPAQYWSDEFGSDWASPFLDTASSRHLGDIDGDGLLDLVGFGYSNAWVARSTGTGFEPVELVLPELGHRWGYRESRALADIDGDGRADIIAFGSTHVRVARATAEGFAPVEYSIPFFGTPAWAAAVDLRLIEDLNGDGLADILVTDGQGVSVWQAIGEGFFGERIALGYGLTDGPVEIWQNRDTPRELVDVDGDGEHELVGFGHDGVAVAELGSALEPIPVPEPGVVMGLMAGAGLLARFGGRRQRLD